MDLVLHVTRLVAREQPGSPESLTGTPGHCDGGNEYDGNLGLRVSAIFVILIGSLSGGLSRKPLPSLD